MWRKLKKKSRNLIRQPGQKNQAALIGSQSVRGFLIGKVGQAAFLRCHGNLGTGVCVWSVKRGWGTVEWSGVCMGAKGWYEGRRFRKKLESKAPNVLGGFCEASHLKRKDSSRVRRRNWRTEVDGAKRKRKEENRFSRSIP